jgi:carbon monoxide dehydrogenase subunit G
MDLNASYTFDAPAERVWAVLLDTSIVGHCLPGSRGLRPLGDDRYEVELAIAVSAISGDFKGTVTLADQDPPRSYRLVVDGAGRPGFVKGQALVTLVPQDAQTVVQIAAHADVGGMIARVGQRLLDGVARLTMDRFFGCLAKQL